MFVVTLIRSGRPAQMIALHVLDILLSSFGIECLDNMIDGDALLSLTERALEMLIPVIGHRMKFLKLVNEL